MKKNKTLIGLVCAVIFCAIIAITFYFLHTKDQKKPTSTKPVAQPKTQEPDRKLAFTIDPDKLRERALEAEALANWESALRWYNLLFINLAQSDSTRGWVAYRQALCYYNLGVLLQAKERLEYGLNNYPNMPEVDNALFLIAQIYAKIGEFENAYKTYDTIIRLFPNRAEEAKAKQSQLPSSVQKPQQK